MKPRQTRRPPPPNHRQSGPSRAKPCNGVFSRSLTNQRPPETEQDPSHDHPAAGRFVHARRAIGFVCRNFTVPVTSAPTNRPRPRCARTSPDKYFRHRCNRLECPFLSLPKGRVLASMFRQICAPAPCAERVGRDVRASRAARGGAGVAAVARRGPAPAVGASGMARPVPAVRLRRDGQRERRVPRVRGDLGLPSRAGCAPTERSSGTTIPTTESDSK